MSKKKDEVIPVWDREAEWQLLYSKMMLAKTKYLEYDGEDETEKKRLEDEWVKLEKLVNPMYVQREEWLTMAGVHPVAQKKEKLSKESKAVIAMTGVSLIAPPLIENRGIIIRNAKDVAGRAWNFMLHILKRR